MHYDTRAVQVRLKELGLDPGPIDGAWGPRTRAAVIRFQTGRGLTPDGIVGPVTRAVLFGAAAAAPRPAESVPTEFPWLVEAARLRGLREVSGSPSSPIIMDWADDLDLAYTDDSVAWCGLYAAHVIRTGLPHADLPLNPLGARNWLQFGDPVTPQLGSVLVFWRGSKAGWQGHVGFYWAEDETHYHVLGGNQADSVSVTRIERGRLLGARWPTGINAPGITRRASASGALISVNEA
jgi:uncharacterized protein (TIGR02594 family)